jgi:hypothetical protein
VAVGLLLVLLATAIACEFVGSSGRNVLVLLSFSVPAFTLFGICLSATRHGVRTAPRTAFLTTIAVVGLAYVLVDLTLALDVTPIYFGQGAAAIAMVAVGAVVPRRVPPPHGSPIDGVQPG